MRLGKVPFPPEVRDRAVRLYWANPAASCASVAATIGCSEESVRRWVHRAGRPKSTVPTAALPDALKYFERRLDRLEAEINDLAGRIDAKTDAESLNEIYALF